MSLNKLLIAVVLLAALSGAVYWSNKKQAAEEGKPAKDAAPELVTLTDDQIDRVEIQKKAGDDVVLQGTSVRQVDHGQTTAVARGPGCQRSDCDRVHRAFLGPPDRGQGGRSGSVWARESATACDGDRQERQVANPAAR